MIRHPALAPLMAALALAGCSSGGASVSGSASETSGSSTGLSSLWERVKSLGLEMGKTYEMPAVAIMADAFMRDYAKRDVPLEAVPLQVLHRSGDTIPRFDEAVATMVDLLRKDMATYKPANVAKITPLDADHVAYSSPTIIAMQPRKDWEIGAMDDRTSKSFDRLQWAA